MRQQSVSIFLLLVLIPLLNLGPALHRLSCFGLHSDSCCDSIQQTSSHCGCDAHSIATVARSKDSAESQFKSRLPVNTTHSDCVLCRFFAKFNAIRSEARNELAGVRCCNVALRAVAGCTCVAVPHHARGPPVLSFAASC
jgi:hypothetical protein